MLYEYMGTPRVRLLSGGVLGSSLRAPESFRFLGV